MGAAASVCVLRAWAVRCASRHRPWLGVVGDGTHGAPCVCRRTHHDAVHAKPGLQRAQVDWLRWTLRAALAERDADLGDGAREELTHALAFIEAKEGEMA